MRFRRPRLEIVAGRIGSGGDILLGTGFHVTYISAGNHAVFIDDFKQLIAASAFPYDGNGSASVLLGFDGPNGFRTAPWAIGSATPAAKPYSFIAVGYPA